MVHVGKYTIHGWYFIFLILSLQYPLYNRNFLPPKGMLFTVCDMYEVLVHDQVVKMLHTKNMIVNDCIGQGVEFTNQLLR